MINKESVNQLINNTLVHRRNDARTKADNIFNYVVKQDPEIKNVYRFYNELLINQTKPNNKIIDIENKITETKNELSKRLQVLGYSFQEIENHYSCNNCSDTGKLINGQFCNCYLKLINEIYEQQCGTNLSSIPNFKDVDFSVFPVQNQTSIKQNYNMAFDFLKSPLKNLLIIGDTGVGKTFLAKTLIKPAINLGMFTSFISAYNLKELFRQSAFAVDDDEKSNLLKPIQSSGCDLLIIDDIGSEPFMNNISNEYFYNLINERTENNAKTIFTSNLYLDKLRDFYDERIFSRLLDKSNGKALDFRGTDLRLKK